MQMNYNTYNAMTGDFLLIDYVSISFSTSPIVYGTSCMGSIRELFRKNIEV